MEEEWLSESEAVRVGESECLREVAAMTVRMHESEKESFRVRGQ